MPAYNQETEFAPGSVVQVMQADVNQEVYGVPEYVSALESELLNEAATLFRRRYCLNGSHAGYILYATGDIDDNDTAALRDALKASKGPATSKTCSFTRPAGRAAASRYCRSPKWVQRTSSSESRT